LGYPEFRVTENDRRALVVEDDALIRMGIADLCQSAGFEPVEAGSAQEALSLFEQDPKFDLLVTDVDMPGPLDGVDLAWAVFRAKPSIALIVVSGKAIQAETSLPAGARFFSKPCPDAELLSAFPPPERKA
jgi:CheY-like chemotaxis protein